MEDEESSPLVQDAQIKSVTFGLSSDEEICKYSVNECPISHPSQLGNPFLGLPLEFGKCESCGTSEPGKCEGHFGYVELPVPVFHPSHVSELKALLDQICLKCLRLKKGKVQSNRGAVTGATCICLDLPEITVKEVKKTDGAISLELRTKKKSLSNSFWNFLSRFGFTYSEGPVRPILPLEALNILREIPEATKKKFAAKGYFPQSGYVLLHLPVPPNCLHVPEFSDGSTVISFDVSHTLLKKVLSKIEQIKRSRSGTANFESHEAESLDLQFSISQYLNLRGTTTGPQDTKRYTIGNNTERKAVQQTSNKQWLEKMKTLFISKGSGFSSRSVITGDPYIGINVIGLPSEIARKITFEERVTSHNMTRLQEMVDKGLCVTYRVGSTSYSLSDGSKGYTSLKIGQVVHRRIMDGDLVFVNRPPSTHKHSLQAFYVYVHDDHTVKINPLICSPFGADFDGDCIHIFYPQSLAAKAEAIELFSVEQQLVNSYNGSLSLQVAHDSLLGLKFLMKYSFLKKHLAQQLAMYSSPLRLPPPALLKSRKEGENNQCLYTVAQLIQSALPAKFESDGEKHEVLRGELIRVDLDRDFIQGSFSEIVGSIFKTGSKEALKFMDIIQPMMMELLSLEGFSVSLVDFDVPKEILNSIRKSIQRQAYVLNTTNPNPNQPMDLRVEGYLRPFKQSIADVIVRSSSVSYLMDTKSDSSITKVVQQLGFLGLQLYRQGRFYSRQIVEDCLSTYRTRFSLSNEESGDHPSEAFGLVKTSFFDGLNPFESLVHAISAREVIVRSSRGLTEPGTLFKNLMAVMRDVVICYDGTVRNMCSNSVVQFSYGDEKDEERANKMAPPGEPVGVLAATAISNPAYKAVLDSSQSNNTSWELMKEVLLTKGKSKSTEVRDRRVVLFLTDCFCGGKFCKERAALAVQSCLKRVRLEDCATDFSIEFQKEMGDSAPCLVGHIHLEKAQLERMNTSMDDVLVRCQDVIAKTKKKKGTVGHLLRKIVLSSCECCGLDSEDGGSPCLQFSLTDDNQTSCFEDFDQLVRVLSNNISPILLDTIIKGDPRVSDAKIVWMGPDEISWVQNYSQSIKGEVAIEVELEEDAVHQSGDAWGTCIDACIPVIHLIDTKRSIPYSIQRVKELLGISCAFEQVVQRLYMAVKGVAKGVLKEHLIIVANSMTCTGNLNGFNTSGYKAMFRSLKIQVPFTEATLYTPMKCFDRAAEKCHVDTLASAVSSCSWGKHVALGTGSAFQIHWDKTELEESNKVKGEKGLYEFLSLVRTSTQKDANGTCLQDVDYLEEHNYEDCPSPDFEGFGAKPTFEDEIGESTWGNNTNGTANGDNGNNNNSSWEVNLGTGTDNGGDSWGGWGNNDKSKGKETVEIGDDDNADPWGSKPATVANGGDDSWGNLGASKEKTNDNANDPWGNFGASKENTNAGANDPWGNLGASKEKTNDGANDPWGNFGAAKENASTAGEDLWCDVGKKNDGPTEVQNGNSWGNEAVGASGASEWENNDPWAQSDQTNQDAPPTPKESDWGNSSSHKKSFEPRKPRRENFNRSENENHNKTWGNNNNAEANQSSGWGAETSTGGAEWGSKEEEEAPPTPKHNTWDPPQNDENTPWGKKNDESENNNPTEDIGDPWSCSSPVTTGTEKEAVEWGKASTPVTAKEGSEWGKVSTTGTDEQGGWGKDTVGTPNSDGWNISTPDHGGNSNNDGWNISTPEIGGNSNNEGWGGPKSRKWSSRGGDNSGGRGGGRGGRPPRRMDGDGGRGRGGFRRPPPDPLTDEEAKIMFEIEPLIQNVRRILREAIDGEKLAEEDEKFITEKVFEFHPDKESKITEKIDYFTVNKHAEYQNTRCFFAVSSDGSAKDFSYIKCMTNFVKLTYVDHGESFCSKFFKKKRDPPNPDSAQPTGDGLLPPPASWTQPGTDTGTHPATATDAGTQPLSDSWTQPATEGGSQPATATWTQPATATEGGTQPVTDSWTQPSAEGGTQPSTEGGTQPRTDSWTQSSTEGGTEPVTDSGAQEGNAGWTETGNEGGSTDQVKDDWA
ncbi:hypothetical protein LUZ60_001586 [Juncus effusus]|nr:hypothetical protein LUZ60_001586 [Juncus effusus]